MELFRLLGTIAVDNADAKKALQDTSNEASKTESKLGKVFSAMGRGAAVAGKAIATGLAVGATAMAGLTVKALQLSGDLEQNLGGAEQVFKDLGGSIDQMSTTIITGYDEATGKAITATSNLETVSKEAYKNMGLSQSDYLATANKMGALFQGAGFETQEALDLSSQAMQRAADVASIMGIDTEAAMEAVAGAAKGNFTMMDNLGVAMNDTAIGAYALEKGINKSTSEMTQQEKIGLAMEMFLDKTAYAAGNYAKENETLAGSLSTAKSAFSNFLSGSGDVTAVLDSFSGLANVVVNSLTEIAPRLTQGISEMVQQLAPQIAPLLQTLLPVLVEGAVTLIDGLVQALPDIVSAITAVIPDLINGIIQIGNAVIQSLPSIIQSIVDAIVAALPDFVNGVVTLVTSLAQALPQILQTLVDALPGAIQTLVSALPGLIPVIVDGIVNMIVILCNNIMTIIQPIIDALPDIIISIVEAVTSNLPIIIEALITLMMSIVEALPEIIQSLVDAIPTIISLLTEALLMNLPQIIAGLIQVVWGIVTALPEIFASLIEGIGNIFVGIWEGIKNVFNITGVSAWFSEVFGKAWEAIKTAWSSVVSFFEGIWEGICEAFSSVGTWFAEIFKDAWEAIKNAWSSVISFFKGIWEGIKGVFNTVKNWFSNIFKGAWSGIKNAWSGVTSFFSGVWSGIKNAFGSVTSWFSSKFSEAWQAIKDVFSGVGEFFGGIWDTISETFTELGTTIGTAISDSVRAGINGVIDAIEKVINGGIGLINGAIDLINYIPGVEIGKISKVSFTRLAKGGVVDKATPAIFGEDGAEAVIPLEKNTEWINKTAAALKKQLVEEGVITPNGTGGVKIDSNSFKNTGKAIVQNLWDGAESASNWLGKKFTGLGIRVLDMLENAFSYKGTEAGYGIIKRYVPTGEDFEKTKKEVYDQARKMKNGTFGQTMARGFVKSFIPTESEIEDIASEMLDAAQQKIDELNTMQAPFRLVDEVAYWDIVRSEIEKGTEAWQTATQNYYDAKNELNSQILDAETNLVNSLEDIYDKIDDRTEDIVDTFDLFSEYTAGNSKPKDWMEMNAAMDSQIKSLELYAEEREKLKSKIGGTALFEELEGMGLKGLSQIQYINQMSDYALQQYLDKYNKREDLARTLATKELAQESADAVHDAFQTFTDSLIDMGVTAPESVRDMYYQLHEAFRLIDTDVSSFTGTFADDTKEMSEKVTEAFDTILNKFSAVKDVLGISSLNFEGNIEIEGAKSGVEWYAKAMHKPMILNQPTIFGYDSKSGKYLGGGEAGSEIVAGSQTLMNMIQTAVAEQNTTITIWLQKVFDILAEYFPQMLDAFEAPIDFNANSMASALAVPMNRELGKISSRKDRGR